MYGPEMEHIPFIFHVQVWSIDDLLLDVNPMVESIKWSMVSHTEENWYSFEYIAV